MAVAIMAAGIAGEAITVAASTAAVADATNGPAGRCIGAFPCRPTLYGAKAYECGTAPVAELAPKAFQRPADGSSLRIGASNTASTSGATDV